MTRLLKVALVLAVLAVASVPAQANTIGMLVLPGCDMTPGGCPAATYSFNIGTTSASLSITINGPLTVGVNNLIGGVNLGFTSMAPNVTSGSTSFGSSSNWNFTTGSLSNNGCTATSKAGFVCAAWTPSPGPITGGFALTQGGTYTWTWNYSAILASSIFVVDQIHIGANYNPAKGLIVSQTVPEPGSLVLLGSGLIGIAGVIRRKLIR